VFVALHRSEGLGLGLMEAIRLGKPDMANYQRQAEAGCFLDELRRLSENRADLPRDKEERRQRLENFRRARAGGALSMRARLSRKMGDIFNRHVLGKF
jgi:hypothetical protein